MEKWSLLKDDLESASFQLTRVIRKSDKSSSEESGSSEKDDKKRKDKEAEPVEEGSGDHKVCR